jgi:hypothetical protein
LGFLFPVSKNKITNEDTISNKPTEDKEFKSNNYIDVLLSLTDEFSVDVIIYLNDKPTKIPLTDLEYGVVCSEFINNCFTQSIKQKLVGIINDQIKTDQNETLISVINMACKTKHIDDDSFIKPSQVFITNNNV